MARTVTLGPIAVLALVVAVTVAVTLAAAPAHAASKPVVMVLYFDNNTGDAGYDGLSKGLGDMMVTDLTAVESIDVVERAKLDALLAEMKLQRSRYFDRRTAQKLGRGIGAQYAVTGAFTSLAPAMRIDARVIRIKTGKVVTAASVTGKADAFFEIHQDLVEKLVAGLDEVLAPADGKRWLEASQSNQVKSAKNLARFGDALDASDRGDLQAASSHMQKVVAAEPKFTLGKARYRAIMKALITAKRNRATLLSGDEATLKQHIDEVLASTKPRNPKRISYMVLRAQMLAARIHKAATNKEPAANWKDDVARFVESQDQLFAETKDMKDFGKSRVKLSSEDEKLADTMEISQAGSVFFYDTPAELMRESAEFIFWNGGGHFTGNSSMSTNDEVPCLFTLSPDFAQAAQRWLEDAFQHMRTHKPRHHERDIMRTLQEIAKGLAIRGQTEAGIARLQWGLEEYPKSDEFQDVEELILSLLEEPPSAWCKIP